jgi:hypothetical protein
MPEGNYTMQVDEAELKQTKSGDGQYIKAKFKVVEGSYDRRVIFHNFNIANPNPKTVEIGLQQLKSFLVAAGVKNPNELTSPRNLEGLSASCKVSQRHDPTYGTQNRILGFTPYESQANAKTKTTAKTKTAGKTSEPSDFGF